MTALRKLLLQRVDVIAMEVDVANHLMRTLLSPEEAAMIAQHPRLIMQKHQSASRCLAQSARSAELLTRFNRGLQRLTESVNGTFRNCMRAPGAEGAQQSGLRCSSR